MHLMRTHSVYIKARLIVTAAVMRRGSFDNVQSFDSEKGPNQKCVST